MDPEAVVERYLQALSAADLETTASLVAVDFHTEHTSALGSSSHGRAAYRERLPGFLAQFAGLHYEIVRAVADGDQVVVRYRLTANFAGHPLDIPGVMWFRVVTGLIAERTDVWDSLTFLRQTGAVEERGEPM